MSSDGRSNYIDQILHTIDYGNLSYKETERRLQKLIDDESYQLNHPSDPDFLNACQTLLFQLHTHGKISFKSHKQCNWEAVQHSISKKEANKPQKKYTLVLVGILVVLIVFLGNAYQFSWFDFSSSTDQQQLTVKGNDITPHLIATAIARNDSFAFYTKENASDLKQLLGFDPLIPHTIGDTLLIKRCDITFFPEEILIYVPYGSSTNDTYALTYTIDYYTDMENAYISMEQNKEGEYKEIANHSVYISQNIDYILACWQEETAVHSVSVSSSIENFESIITILVGGNEK